MLILEFRNNFTISNFDKLRFDFDTTLQKAGLKPHNERSNVWKRPRIEDFNTVRSIQIFSHVQVNSSN